MPGMACPTPFRPVFPGLTSASSVTEKFLSSAFVAKMLPRCRPTRRLSQVVISTVGRTCRYTGVHRSISTSGDSMLTIRE